MADFKVVKNAFNVIIAREDEKVDGKVVGSINYIPNFEESFSFNKAIIAEAQALFSNYPPDIVKQLQYSITKPAYLLGNELVYSDNYSEVVTDPGITGNPPEAITTRIPEDPEDPIEPIPEEYVEEDNE